MTRGSPRLGVYGLHLPGLGAAARLLVPAPPDWPTWQLLHQVPEGEVEDLELETVTATRARLRLRPGVAELDRDRGATTLVVPLRPGDVEIVHPLLAGTAGVAAWWRGQLSLHAGGFVSQGRAWGVLGAKGMGKSSTLAALSEDGVEVVTDDVMVMDAGRALAGPRCIDLRRETAELLGKGEPLGVIGARERWRLPLPAVAPQVEVAGWVVLGWGPDVALEEVEAPLDRLQTLASSLSLRLPPASTQDLLDCAALPMLRLTRPRHLDAMPAALAAMLEGVERAGGADEAPAGAS